MTDNVADEEALAPPSIPADPSLVEDVLLLFQPSSGMIAGEATLFYVLVGAAVTDLALSGAIESRQERRLLQRVHAVGDERPTDSLLAPIWDALEEKPRGAGRSSPTSAPDARNRARTPLSRSFTPRPRGAETSSRGPSSSSTVSGKRLLRRPPSPAPPLRSSPTRSSSRSRPRPADE